MKLNRCRCGNRPDYVTQLNGLVRISCVLAKCNEIVCARPGMAARAWNEINPLVDDEQTKPHNPVPTHRPYVAEEPLETLCRGLEIVEPLDDEIPVTVEAPVSADELPTDPTGGVK